MWIVIAHAEDGAARWAAEGLERLGLTPVLWIDVESLGYADSWMHRLGNTDNHLRIQLRDGRIIDSTQVLGVLNRVWQVPSGHSLVMRPEDRLYAQQEMHAFYLSWLHAFEGPVLNPPKPTGLGGPMMHTLRWFSLATEAGLTVAPITLTSQDTPEAMWRPDGGIPPWMQAAPLQHLFVAGDTALPAPGGPVQPPSSVLDACLHLSHLAEVPLLGLSFYVDAEGTWILVRADTFPDLRMGGDPLLHAVADALTAHTLIV